jgi:hypothetical protein
MISGTINSMQMPRQLRFIILVLFLCPVLSRAQDNNLLAKLAYENAETALSEKKFSEGISELKKVDESLGKLTPRSQFLRVQLWIGAAEIDPVYLDSAIQQSKKYLALSKSFEIPEEKQMETLRQLQKMEKDKVVFGKKAKEEKEAKALLQKVEMNADSRDLAAIYGLTGLDMGKEILDQLIKTGRLINKDVRYLKKHQVQQVNTYVHNGHFYSIPVIFYYNFQSKSEPFRINGLDTEASVSVYYTTINGSFQELTIALQQPVSHIETYVEQVSAILGFKPDAQVIMNANSINNDSNWPTWGIKDYTVSLVKYSDELAKTLGYPYAIKIMRHYPDVATLIGAAPLAPWK